MVDIHNLQMEVASWVDYNFPNSKPYRPLLGAVEELGELCHAQLKSEQGIRGDDALHQKEKIDAVGDIIVYLCDYCSQCGISLEAAVRDTWDKVKQRNWIMFPKNGRTE